MPSVGWGSNYSLNDHVLVGENDEIPKGSYAYVINQQTTPEVSVPKATWEAMLNGDFSSVKTQIEQGISGCQVKMIRCSWDGAFLFQPPIVPPFYVVRGFRVEALVYNAGAAQTGLEIIVIILAIAILAAVIAAIIVGAWVVWRVVSAAEQLGPAVTIAVGLAVLAGIGILAFVLLGGKAKYQGKKRSFAIGRGDRPQRGELNGD